MLVDYEVELRVESYIAHPYWAETEQVVNIAKKSGINRARSDAKRAEKLREYLQTIKMTVKEYERLCEKAALEWHFDPSGWIVIPRHQLAGSLVQTIMTRRTSQTPFKDGGELRSLCQISDFVTDRKKADRIWARFVRPSKDGKPLSNQRSERRNQVIDRFTAKGTVSFDPAEIDTDPEKAVEKMRQLWSMDGKYIGVGASRKMGMGRFEVVSFAPAA